MKLWQNYIHTLWNIFSVILQKKRLWMALELALSSPLSDFQERAQRRNFKDSWNSLFFQREVIHSTQSVAL